MHFSGKLYFYFVALILMLQNKCNSKEAPGKKREVSSFPGCIYWGENVQIESLGASASCWRRGICPGTSEVLTPCGVEPWTRTRRRCQHSSVQCQGLGVQLLRSVSVRGRSVTFMVKFFLLITIIIIIIIIIIIFIIIMNTVSHISTPKSKLIYSLSCDANMVGLTCISFSPPPA